MGSPPLPASWAAALAGEVASPRHARLHEFLDAEYAAGPVYPPRPLLYAALELTPLDAVRVVLIGQDPYHGEGQAHGLSFSVPAGVRPPPSLRNALRELQDDLGLPPPDHGNLEAWAKRGVLLVNAVLTVRSGDAGSHRGKGWEEFTDAVVAAVDAQPRPVVFLLWGADAKRKGAKVNRTRHRVVETAHPSPLSVKKFLGSRPFSAVNAALAELGEPPIDWRLPSRAEAGA